MNVEHSQYAMCDYNQTPSENDEFKLGDVVIKDSEDGIEIGVIIQCHGNNEYRTDMFGNCCFDEKYGNIQKATVINIMMNRPSLLD